MADNRPFVEDSEGSNWLKPWQSNFHVCEYRKMEQQYCQPIYFIRKKVNLLYRIRFASASLFFILLIILVACNKQATETLQRQELPTQSSTLQYHPNATASMRPIAQTRLASMATYAPTATAKAMIALKDCNGYPDKVWNISEQIYSPSGMWRIAYCQNPNTGANYTKAINVKNNVAWEVPYIDQEGQNRPEGMTGGQMNFEMWSFDEKYAYFSRYYCCIDGPGMLFSNGLGLYQLDLSTGKIIEIESGSLSPNGYRLIYYKQDNHEVILKDLKSQQMKLFKIDDQLEDVGVFQWSPDGSKIAFSAADENWFEADSGFILYLIDINTNNIKQLLFEPPHKYIPSSWLSNKEISISEVMTSDEFLLDITTNNLIPLPWTATPSP